MTGRHSRNKGARFENEVAARISDAMYRDVRRTLGQARDSGTDIHPEGYAIECKRYKSLPKLFDGALAQAIAGKKAPTDIPVVVGRGDGGEPVALLRFDDLLTMIAKVAKADDIFSAYGEFITAVRAEIQTMNDEDAKIAEALG